MGGLELRIKEMQIGRYNFKQRLPFMLNTLREADFVAVDFEFGGINLHPNFNTN